MKRERFDGSHPDWVGDLPAWLMEHAETNDEQMERLRRNLRLARERELTPRQQQVLTLYYDRKMKVPQIAGELGVNRSTVSRTIRRARSRLYRFLRYSL
ncbi:sigma-70 family RNA polymerase sigma factor [Dysosmobacter sp.]|uniref:sigma-70 family RNA polymerase sigma factor n=1 Tax=Dysosmobacter sp. TaxID=2591382 RepID=UPI002A8BA983|nr:sigma-70 family RNA polymerase sigma factor [Dysosmobacter sp.]MDY3985685.1 sigma-70 family RNA polymerase sigma factor [Dysosmobacter sp.]